MAKSMESKLLQVGTGMFGSTRGRVHLAVTAKTKDSPTTCHMQSCDYCLD